MAGLPINIPVPSENSITSYDWNDIASGVGYVTFYALAKGTDDNSMILVTNPLNNGTSGVDFSSTEEDSIYLSAFTTPRKIGGEAYASLQWYQSGGNNITWNITFYHVDAAGTETAISSATATSGGGASTGDKVGYTPISVTNKNFAIGESLRIKVKLNNDSANLYCLGSGTKQCIFVVPFKIDL
jgi:hypothetical protein